MSFDPKVHATSSSGSLERVDRLAVLEAAYPEYMHGNCHILALALSRISNQPLCALLEEDFELSRVCLVHAAVRISEESVLDLKGVRHLEQVVADFATSDAEWQSLSSAECLAFCEDPGRPRAQIEAEIAKASGVAAELWQLAQRELENA